MGKVTGVLSFLTWMANAFVQEPIGHWIDRTGLFSESCSWPASCRWFGFLAIVMLWNRLGGDASRAVHGNRS